ncbi:polysaccharide biosynthesis tyrosine autokinase [Geothrix sp. 21YS21S-2]|uniref:polysaccharide biosynthesis tyrosine autokinase n=1 Tax=Geothrix sp. 21YS21S-2 TaxID=3068893 RepID=UPI0027B889BE|nr:polysaccharide biosynthesis tyrosine autokinase [Geothrix sp. 21YS21S-2]
MSEVFANLWEGRYLILGSVFLFGAVGLLYVLSATPIYQVEGLLQTETAKSYSTQTAEFTKMEGVFAQTTVAQGEIEIVKSNLVLGRVVTNLGLDIQAAPVLTPLVGKLLNRNPLTRPKVEVTSFEVPDKARGTLFKLTALAGGLYRWSGPDGSVLAEGKPGERLSATWNGWPMKLKVRTLRGKPGQEFSLSMRPTVDAINSLRLGLMVEERGKNANQSSNLLGLSLTDPDPDQAALILNEILNQYVRQTIERKSGDSSKALILLQNQRPALQAQLSEAESRLNDYRRQNGALDLAREGEVFLQQGASLEAQISTLKQRRQELLRTYTEHSDLVTTTDQQIAHLQQELSRTSGRVSALPKAQQEIVRLTRDAQVKSEMYTSLLTSIQQLQNTLAGSVGNARVVDYAIPPFDSIAPRKKVLMVLFLFIGTTVGVGMAIIRRLMRRGVEDHRIIEAKLGLPILVTIPHSESQDNFNRAIRRHAQGTHLLAMGEPEDIATESMRSLRTVLHFMMEDVTNRIVLITGPSPEVGKSFVSTNLAAVLAQGGAKVLLVDADLRRGNLHRTFGIKGRAGGLSEALTGRADWKTLLKTTPIPGLSLLSTGVLPPDPLVLLMSPSFSEFMGQVSEAFDFVIVDAPPILPVSDAIVLGSKADTILLVAKYGKHPLEEIQTCQNRLRHLEGKLKGCLFNDIKLVKVGGLYGYYKYEFDYKYERGGS